MLSIPEYINTLNPDQLHRCKEILEQKLEELSKQKRVKLWYVVDDDIAKYFQSFDEVMERLFKVYKIGHISNTIKLIDYIYVYESELEEYLKD